MKTINNLFLMCLGTILLLSSCNQDTFTGDPTIADLDNPSGLTYHELINGREYAAVKTGTPNINTGGLTPFYEIISGRKADGTQLDETFMNDVSISNATPTVNLVLENGELITIKGDVEEILNDNGELDFDENNELIINENAKLILHPDGTITFQALNDDSDLAEYNGLEVVPAYHHNTKHSGVITITDENQFGIGNYYFTIKATTEIDKTPRSTTFEDVFHLGVGPGLVTNLLSSPIAQNIVVGTENTTTQPYLITGNADVTFALGSEEQNLDIDTETGIISLKEGYTTTEDHYMYPKVIVTSNISQETTEFQGESFLILVASNEAIDLPKQTNYFFYPTLESENKLYGYTKTIVNVGSTTPAKTWLQSAPANIAAAERPDNVTGNKSLWTNPTAGNYLAHESFVTINPQDLTQYSLGYDLAMVFYTKNQYVEYMPSGISPTELEIYISTDYTGDDDTSTWTKINDQLSTQINSLSATPFIGFPYPGDQKLKGDMTNHGQNTSRNADAKWVRSEMNLNAYKDVKNFTLKFKLISNYTKAEYPDGIKGVGGSRPGRYYISDIHFKASEE